MNFKKETLQKQLNQIWRMSATLLIFILTACGGKSEKLSELNQIKLSSNLKQSVQLDFCTDPAYDQKQYLKTVIILDHSGSNQRNFLLNTDGSGSPAIVGGSPVLSTQYATDPLGKTRYGDVNQNGTLLNYLKNVTQTDPLDPTRFFALVDFSDEVTTYPTNSSGFTSDLTSFYNYVEADSVRGGDRPNDGGATNYLGALESAYKIISSDVKAAQACAALPLGSASPGAWCPKPGVQVASSYVIVFMSDGSPITNISGIGVDSGGNLVVTGAITIDKQPADQIISQVGGIMALSANTKFVSSINLFTIYYYYPGNVDLSGQQILGAMAKVGNGVAYNALSGSQINYFQFQPPKKRIKFTLADVFVSNESVAWWNDGNLQADGDGDGLPDEVERDLGTNPASRYSFTNGISDFVRHQLNDGAACLNKDTTGLCTDPVTDYRTGVCSGVKRSRVGNNTVYQSSDPSGLNDCEKLLLNDAGGINNPDSNRDGIPDWLELKSNVPFQVGAAPALNTPLQDGYTLYKKIKYSLPLSVPNGQIFNGTPAKYNMQLVSSNDDQDCYRLLVSDLPSLSQTDKVRVELIERAELLQDQIIYRSARKSFAPGQSVLTFKDWNDPTEKAAATWEVWQ